MTEEIKEEETISNQVFNNWKNHDCTKALIGIIEDCLFNLDGLVLEEISGTEEIQPKDLYFCRGGKYIAEQIKEKLLDKKELEYFLNNTEEENADA